MVWASFFPVVCERKNKMNKKYRKNKKKYFFMAPPYAIFAANISIYFNLNWIKKTRCLCLRFFIAYTATAKNMQFGCQCLVSSSLSQCSTAYAYCLYIYTRLTIMKLTTTPTIKWKCTFKEVELNRKNARHVYTRQM